MRLIDVEALIDDCKKYLNELNPSRDGKECTRIHWLIGILNDAPTIEPEQRWIPLGRPMSGGMYLVTLRQKFEGKESYRVRIMRLNEGHWMLPKHFPEWINEGIEQEVIAWMTLPEPYRDGGEADEHTD